MQQQNLTSGSAKRHFFHYLVPSVFATLTTSVYVIADTVMIGQYEGEGGIVALNIVLPLYSALFGVGALLGVGAGVLYSIFRGRGQPEDANACVSAALILLLAFNAVFFTLSNLFFTPLLRLLGAEGEILRLAAKYARFVTYGCPLFSVSTFLSAIVRNDGAPRLAMAGVVISGLTNVALDYVFIFVLGMGMTGAALATVIGFSINIAVSLSHFFRKRCGVRLRLRGCLGRSGRILLTGLPSFVYEMSAGLLIFLFNLQLLRYTGQDGVVVYGVISNVIIVAMSLFNGVAQAAQPVVAANFGAGLTSRGAEVKRAALLVSLGIGVILLVVCEALPGFLLRLFTKPTDGVTALAPFAMRVYFIALPFMAMSIVYATVFQSVLRPRAAFTVSLGRGLVLSGLLGLLLPLIAPAGIWFAVPAAEALTLAAALVFDFSRRKKDVGVPSGDEKRILKGAVSLGEKSVAKGAGQDLSGAESAADETPVPRAADPCSETAAATDRSPKEGDA